jgi:hypothetical protein
MQTLGRHRRMLEKWHAILFEHKFRERLSAEQIIDILDLTR